MPGKHEEIRVVVVVSGQPEHIQVNLEERLEHLVRIALERSGNQGQAPSGWELRREDGALLDQSETVGEARIPDGATLFLNPQAGAGGAI